MGSDLRRRVKALEGGGGGNGTDGAEASFWRAVEAAQADFVPGDAKMLEAERLALSPVRLVAWCHRFTRVTDLAGILALQGRGVPSHWIGWQFLTAWIPGDDRL